MKDGEIITHNLYDEDRKNLQELIFFMVNNSSYSLNDFRSMDISEFFDVLELIEKEITRKNKQK